MHIGVRKPPSLPATLHPYRELYKDISYGHVHLETYSYEKMNV